MSSSSTRPGLNANSSIAIRHLRAFLAIAEEASFTRAAHRLHISQPGLSSMVQDMESQLSCRLFDRTTRSVSLTEAGRRLLPVARHFIDELDQLSPLLAEAAIEQRRTLKVAVTPMFATSVIPRVYMQLVASHPDVELVIQDVQRPEVERLVRAGEVDCGVGIFESALPELTAEPLFAFDFVYGESRNSPIILGPDWPERQGSEVPDPELPWSRIPDVPFVELGRPSEVQRIIDRGRMQAGVPSAKKGIPLHNLETMIAMAYAGAGPVILPSFAIELAERNGVRCATLIEPRLSAHFHVITRNGRTQPAVLATFVDVLRNLKEFPSLMG